MPWYDPDDWNDTTFAGTVTGNFEENVSNLPASVVNAIAENFKVLAPPAADSVDRNYQMKVASNGEVSWERV